MCKVKKMKYYLLIVQDYVTFKSEVDEKAKVYGKLKRVIESQSMVSITVESWQEIERLWTKLEAQVRFLFFC